MWSKQQRSSAKNIKPPAGGSSLENTVQKYKNASSKNHKVRQEASSIPAHLRWNSFESEDEKPKERNQNKKAIAQLAPLSHNPAARIQPLTEKEIKNVLNPRENKDTVEIPSIMDLQTANQNKLSPIDFTRAKKSNAYYEE